MKVALIPPFELLDTALVTDYHLYLPQLLHNKAYAAHYYDSCMDVTQHVILDNGAAEGQLLGDMELIDLIEEMCPDELVIPDDMGNFVANIQKAKHFLERWGHYMNQAATAPDLMFVAQGSNLAEFVSSALWAHNHPFVKTIAIPRHANNTCGEPTARAQIADALQMFSHWKKPIHFLGADPAYVNEVKNLYRLFSTQPIVRGIDTSAPYNFAYTGISLKRAAREGLTVARPHGYFMLDGDEFDVNLVRVNIKTFIGWAQGEE